MAPAPLGSNWDDPGLLLTCPELAFAVNLIHNRSYLEGYSLPPLWWVRMPRPRAPFGFREDSEGDSERIQRGFSKDSEGDSDRIQPGFRGGFREASERDSERTQTGFSKDSDGYSERIQRRFREDSESQKGIQRGFREDSARIQ